MTSEERIEIKLMKIELMLKFFLNEKGYYYFDNVNCRVRKFEAKTEGVEK